MSRLQTITARRGKAVPVKQGQAIRIVNTSGHQVVDFWAYAAGHLTEFSGMEQCRASWLKLCPEVGDHLYSNRRRPLMTLEEDTSPGRHDTVIAPCDNERYGLLGCTEYHDNCKDNMHAALLELGYSVPFTPASLNLFMNIPWQENGSLSFEPPISKAGDYVVWRARLDCIAVMSCCPQDILTINNRNTVDAHFAVVD
jgi:uncharacterized protein YcgI (DUF1989 family)